MTEPPSECDEWSAMAFYSNFSRAFRFNKFLQNLGEKWQRKKYVTPIRFHRSIARNVSNFESSKRVVKAVLILSYKPQHRTQIYENDLLAKNTEYESFFDIILIVARILVIGSILTGLTVIYLITRFTHGHVFPIILRKGNYSLVKGKHISIAGYNCRYRISRANFYKIRSMGVNKKRFVSWRCLSYAVIIAT